MLAAAAPFCVSASYISQQELLQFCDSERVQTQGVCTTVRLSVLCCCGNVLCRYYRLMASQSSSSSSALSQELEAARAALAFKAVAVVWREQESEIMRLCVTQQVRLRDAECALTGAIGAMQDPWQQQRPSWDSHVAASSA